MDYGVFGNPSMNRAVLGIALALIISGISLALVAFFSDKVHEEKRALFGYRVSYRRSMDENGVLSVVIIIIVGVLILVIGFFATAGIFDNENTVRENYASPGLYKVVDAKLVYHRDVFYKNGTTTYKTQYEPCLTDENGNCLYQLTRPDYFELKLEGRVDTSHPSKLRMMRIVRIPYSKMAENYRYLPAELPSKQIESEKGAILLNAPVFVVKYKNSWWQFVESEPVQEEKK